MAAQKVERLETEWAALRGTPRDGNLAGHLAASLADLSAE